MKPKTNGSIDYVLFTYFLILLGFGLVMLTSASSVIGFERFGDSYFFIKRQILFGALPGLAAMFILIKLPQNFFKKISLFLYIFGIALLILVLIPGVGQNFDTTARSWLVLGNFSFQPSEFMKLPLILFLASYLDNLGRGITNLKQGFLPALLIALVPIGLIMAQPDIGTASILFAIILSMLFLSGSKLSHMAMLFCIGAVILIITIALAPHRAARLMTFMHPELDPQGIGYHINQAYLAIGSGGLFGFGLGHSRQKFQYLPEVHADSIFAIISEELGFFVASGLIILLLLICYRGLALAKKTKSQFAYLTVTGIILWVLLQSCLNIGAMLGLIPLTGVPLPFISHGGTALFIALSALGIMLNVSKT